MRRLHNLRRHLEALGWPHSEAHSYDERCANCWEPQIRARNLCPPCYEYQRANGHPRPHRVLVNAYARYLQRAAAGD